MTDWRLHATPAGNPGLGHPGRLPAGCGPAMSPPAGLPPAERPQAAGGGQRCHEVLVTFAKTSWEA